MKPSKTYALATLLLAFLAGSSAWAQCAPYYSSIALEPTKLGESFGAIATSSIHLAKDCSELFGITVSGKLENGEILAVMVVSKSGTFQAGGITVFDGMGQLVLDSNRDVSDVFPVNQLESIQVIRNPIIKGPARITRNLMPPQVLLQGAF